MAEETKIDKDYLEAFNLGYELAKELNIKSPMFKDLNPENIRITSIQEGMAQYLSEINQRKHKVIDRPQGSDNMNNAYRRNRDSSKDNGKDKGLAI